MRERQGGVEVSVQYEEGNKSVKTVFGFRLGEDMVRGELGWTGNVVI